MGERHSRLSADDARSKERSLSSSCSEKSRCPWCCQPQLTTVNVDGELRISICDGCDHGYGVDDSMDAEALALLVADEELCRDVQVTVITCNRCQNNDVDRFVVEESDQDRLLLRIRCMNCSSISDIQLQDCAGDAAWNGDDTWTTEVLGNVNDDDDDGGGSLRSDCDSGYVVDSDDDHDVEGCNEVEPKSPDVVPFSCISCGNNEVDCFEKHYDAVSGDLSRVTCLACDDEKEIETFFGVECWHCGNDRQELFDIRLDDYGRITLLRCKCGKRLHLPGQSAVRKGRRNDAKLGRTPSRRRKSGQVKRKVAEVGRENGLGWTKIADLRHVQRGDHIAWHKWYAIWHHAIVVDVPDGGRALTVVHYSGGITRLDGHFASVREETLDVNPSKEDLYRIDYPHGDICPAEQVVQRARSRLSEAKYNPFTNNCEHFARWCKTERAESGQVRKFTDRLGLACRSAVTKATQEAAAGGLQSLVAGSVSRAGVSGIRQRFGQVFGATSGAVRNVKCGALACNVAINLALEAALFTKDTVVAYRKYISGAISRDDFYRHLRKLGGECLGGLIGCCALGILGEVFIPIPFLGGFVGCTLGNLIGRYIGAIIGKQLAAIKQ